VLLLEATIGLLVNILVYLVLYPVILIRRGLWLLKRAVSRRVHHREAPPSSRDELEDEPGQGVQAPE
jgi:hypothetical protein